MEVLRGIYFFFHLFLLVSFLYFNISAHVTGKKLHVENFHSF